MTSSKFFHPVFASFSHCPIRTAEVRHYQSLTGQDAPFRSWQAFGAALKSGEIAVPVEGQTIVWILDWEESGPEDLAPTDLEEISIPVVIYGPKAVVPKSVQDERNWIRNELTTGYAPLEEEAALGMTEAEGPGGQILRIWSAGESSLAWEHPDREDYDPDAEYLDQDDDDDDDWEDDCPF